MSIRNRTEERSRIGDTVEYRAVVWLLDQGFEVFQNVSRIGPVDLVSISSEGIVTKIDVKKCSSLDRADGKIYHQHKKDEQKELQVQFLYYDEVNDSFAWSIEEIYSKAGKPYRKQRKCRATTTEIEIKFSQLFESIPEAARYYEVNPRTVREYMRTHPEITLEQAISRSVNKTKKVIVNNQEFSNRVEACKTFKVNPSSVEERMRNRGESIEQAIQHFVERNKKKNL